MISRSELARLKALPLKLNSQPLRRGTTHLYERIAEAVAAAPLGEDALASGKFKIHTTILAEAQNAAQKALLDSLAKAEARPGIPAPEIPGLPQEQHQAGGIPAGRGADGGSRNGRGARPRRRPGLRAGALRFHRARQASARHRVFPLHLRRRIERQPHARDARRGRADGQPRGDGRRPGGDSRRVGDGSFLAGLRGENHGARGVGAIQDRRHRPVRRADGLAAGGGYQRRLRPAAAESRAAAAPRGGLRGSFDETGGAGDVGISPRRHVRVRTRWSIWTGSKTRRAGWSIAASASRSDCDARSSTRRPRGRSTA